MCVHYAFLQECLHQDPAKRPTAPDAFRRLVAMDPAARPSQPRPLYRRGTATPHQLLPCLQRGMQALPSQPRAALAPMLASMVEAASRIVMAADVQALCAQRGLTLVEAQCVSVYTMDARSFGGAREDSVFYEFNLALRAGDSEHVQRWGEFAKVFCDAVDKLPSVSCVVFRGLDQPLTQVSHLYVKGSTVFFNGVTSTTTDKGNTLQQFGKGADGRPGTLLRIAATDVKSIAAFSAFPDESELVAAPNSRFRVAIVLESADVCRVWLLSALWKTHYAHALHSPGASDERVWGFASERGSYCAATVGGVCRTKLFGGRNRRPRLHLKLHRICCLRVLSACPDACSEQEESSEVCHFSLAETSETAAHQARHLHLLALASTARNPFPAFLQPCPQAELLFQEGLRLYGEQRFSDAAASWGQAVLLQHAASHAYLSSLLFEGRPDVPKDTERAFATASAGAVLGCPHSKGALGRCYVCGIGVVKDEGKGLALGRESAAAGSCFGQFVVGRRHDAGLGATTVVPW